jgi:hypothetical protein
MSASRTAPNLERQPSQQRQSHDHQQLGPVALGCRSRFCRDEKLTPDLFRRHFGEFGVDDLGIPQAAHGDEERLLGADVVACELVDAVAQVRFQFFPIVRTD